MDVYCAILFKNRGISRVAAQVVFGQVLGVSEWVWGFGCMWCLGYGRSGFVGGDGGVVVGLELEVS